MFKVRCLAGAAGGWAFLEKEVQPYIWPTDQFWAGHVITGSYKHWVYRDHDVFLCPCSLSIHGCRHPSMQHINACLHPCIPGRKQAIKQPNRCARAPGRSPSWSSEAGTESRGNATKTRITKIEIDWWMDRLTDGWMYLLGWTVMLFATYAEKSYLLLL